MDSDTQRRIRDRAYELWVEGGRREGSEDENWLRAERELASAPKAARPAGRDEGETVPPRKGSAKAETPAKASAGQRSGPKSKGKTSATKASSKAAASKPAAGKKPSAAKRAAKAEE